MVKEEIHLQENTLFDLDPDPKVRVTQNAAQFPLHHVNYAPIKFAVAITVGLGGDANTRT